MKRLLLLGALLLTSCGNAKVGECMTWQESYQSRPEHGMVKITEETTLYYKAYIWTGEKWINHPTTIFKPSTSLYYRKVRCPDVQE